MAIQSQLKQLDPQVIRWFTLVSIEIAFVVMLAFLVIVPQFNAINEARDNLAAQQALLDNLKNKSDLLTNFTFQFAQKDELIRQVLPPTKDVGIMLASIRQIAQGSGVETTGYSLTPGELVDTAVSPNPPANSIPSVVVEMTINGTPLSIQKFLSSINQSLPLKSIENLQVVRNVVATRADITQILETKLTMKVYFLPTPSIKDPSPQLSPIDKDQAKVLDLVTGYTKVETATNSTPAPLGNTNLFGLWVVIART